VLLSGALAGACAQGGAAWSTLHFLLGMRDLGHEVVLAEPVEGADFTYRDEVAAQFGLDAGDMLVVDVHSPERTERDHARLTEFAATADVHVNLSGRLRAPQITRSIPARIYFDLDPGYTQAWVAQGADMGLEDHTHLVTVGLGITGGVWSAMPHPIFLPEWPPSPAPRDAAFTTLGNWRSFGTLEHGGRNYGPRAHTVRAFLGLPEKVAAPLRAALAIHPGDQEDVVALQEHGWELLDPRHVANTPRDFEAFVRSSAGEIGLPKDGYVKFDCGWFSERSAAYLASGRPVASLRTGFERHLPTGAGLLTFADEAGAAEAIRALLEDPENHASAARTIAEDHFDSRRLLAELLEGAGQ